MLFLLSNTAPRLTNTKQNSYVWLKRLETEILLCFRFIFLTNWLSKLNYQQFYVYYCRNLERVAKKHLLWLQSVGLSKEWSNLKEFPAALSDPARQWWSRIFSHCDVATVYTYGWRKLIRLRWVPHHENCERCRSFHPATPSLPNVLYGHCRSFRPNRINHGTKRYWESPRWFQRAPRNRGTLLVHIGICWRRTSR